MRKHSALFSFAPAAATVVIAVRIKSTPSVRLVVGTKFPLIVMARDCEPPS